MSLVLGLDPSLTAFGWSVFDTEPRRTVTRAGVWETWADKAIVGAAADNKARFEYLCQQLWALTSEVRPDRIFVEGTVFVPGKMTAGSIHSLGRVRGFADVIGAALNIEIIELSPQTVKKGLGIVLVRPAKKRFGGGFVLAEDKGKAAPAMASKQEVRDAVVALYPEAAELIPNGKVGENCSDAIAVAHVGLAQWDFKDKLRSGSSW